MLSLIILRVLLCGAGWKAIAAPRAGDKAPLCGARHSRANFNEGGYNF